jgi:hypothetical protein
VLATALVKEAGFHIAGSDQADQDLAIAYVSADLMLDAALVIVALALLSCALTACAGSIPWISTAVHNAETSPETSPCAAI